MTNFLIGILELTAGMSLLIALALLCLRLFGKRFTAKCRYIIWALILIRLAFPIGGEILPALIEVPIESPAARVEVPENDVNTPTVPWEGEFQIPTAPAETYTPQITPPYIQGGQIEEQNPTSIPGYIESEGESQSSDKADLVITTADVVSVIAVIYFAGVIIFLTWNLLAYFIYTRQVLKNARKASPEWQKYLVAICKNKKLKSVPEFYVSEGIHSPVAFGLFRRKIVLPSIEFSGNGLIGTLAHEVTHCKRRDLWVKFITLFARAVNWFNPLVHIAASRCDMEMELSCDEDVLSGMNEDIRRSYGNVMLEIARSCSRKRSPLTTHFNPRKNAVNERIMNILDMTKKKRGRVIIAVTLVLCIIAGTIIGCSVDNDDIDDINKNKNEEIDKLIDSITYVDFSSENFSDRFIPVSYIKNGVQLIDGDLGLQGNILADAPKADTLKKANGIASDGEWNFFPYEVKHTEYTYDNQPENKEWTDYYRTMLAKDTPIIITDVYSLEQNGMQIDVVTASNIVMDGDIAKIYTKDDTYPTPNIPQSERTSIYIICAVFIEGQEPTKLYELSESFLTINDMGGISCDPTVYSGYFQQIYSTLQYDESGEVSVCPIYCNMNGELNLRSYMNKPAFVLADIDGDGKVELVQNTDQGSSDMSVCIIYDYTNNGYEIKASLRMGGNGADAPSGNENEVLHTFELTDNSRPNDPPSTFSIVTPSSWKRSGDLDILAETLTFSSGVSESKKRMEVNQYNDLKILLSKDGGGVNNKIVVLDPDEVTSGITENGYKYIYYREEIQNEDNERYTFHRFYIDLENGVAYLVNFISFLDYDTADYFETVILPAVNSIEISTIEQDPNTIWKEHSFNQTWPSNGTPVRFSITTPSSWERDEGGSIFSENLTYASGLTASKKRMEVGKQNGMTFETWKSEWLAIEESEYEYVGPYSGVTDEGYAYYYYYRDPQIEKDVNWRIYSFLVLPKSGSAFTISIHHNRDYDPADYLETVILPVVKSVKIGDAEQGAEPSKEQPSILFGNTWYNYYIDGNEYKLYTLEFNASSGQMQWNRGWFESEWENTFAGSYSIDESGVFHGDLYDTIRDESIQISFTVDVVNTTTDKGELVFTLTDANIDMYKEIVGQSITFLLNNAPMYEDLTQTSETIGIVEIIDIAKRDNIPLDDSLQNFYSDSEYEYFYFGNKSEYVVVKYSNGSEKTAEEALQDGDITIGDLDKYEIAYRKVEK